jgi:hypothetical protein
MRTIEAEKKGNLPVDAKKRRAGNTITQTLLLLQNT